MKSKQRKPINPILASASAATLLLLTLLPVSCSRKPQDSVVATAPGEIAERVGNVAITRLDVPAFSALSRDDRIAAFFLCKAALAGRDVVYDQIHPKQVEIVDFLERIGQNIGYAAPDYFVDPFRLYLKMIWVHNGFYDLHTLHKLSSPITSRELGQLTSVALSNTGGRLGTLIDLTEKQQWIINHLFKPGVDSVLFLRSAAPGADVLEHSLVNFYEGVTTEEVRSFQQKYPRNSKLEKVQGRLVEDVYRTGDYEWAPGLYKNELSHVNENLEKARPYLHPSRVNVGDDLIQYFRTGQPSAFERAAATWRKNAVGLEVDFILGFLDKRFDPLHNKGLWTGIVFLSDHKAQSLIDSLVTIRSELLARFPGTLPTYNPFPPAPSNLRAVQSLITIGSDGPLCPDVYYDPPEPEEASGGRGQVLIFTNVLTSRALVRARYVESQFCSDSAEVDLLSKYAVDLAFAETALVEILGFSTGQLERENRFDRVELPQMLLQSTLNKLAYLWLVRDPVLVDAGLFPDRIAGDEAYRSFARQYLGSLGSQNAAEDGLNSRVTQLIAGYLMKSGASLTIETKGDKTFCRVRDFDLMHQQIGELAQKISHVLQKESRKDMADLISDCMPTEDLRLQEEIRNRFNRAGAFSQVAFIFPLVEADMNPMGGVDKVYLRQPRDFATEMYLYSGLTPPIEK